MKLTIKKIFRNQKVSKKTNKPYTSVGILTNEYGDNQYINGFGNKDNEQWKEGDIIDVEIKEGEWNGNKTLNFITPTKIEKNNQENKNEIMDALRKVFIKLEQIENRIK